MTAGVGPVERPGVLVALAGPGEGARADVGAGWEAALLRLQGLTRRLEELEAFIATMEGHVDRLAPQRAGGGRAQLRVVR